MSMTGGQDDGRPDGSGSGDDAHTVTYVFPIEVIVVGALSEEDQRLLEERVWSRFAEALQQLP